MVCQDVAVEAVVVPHFLDVFILEERLESMEHSFLLILHSHVLARKCTAKSKATYTDNIDGLPRLCSKSSYLVIEQGVHPDHVLPLSHGWVGPHVDLRTTVQGEADDLPRCAWRLP